MPWAVPSWPEHGWIQFTGAGFDSTNKNPHTATGLFALMNENPPVINDGYAVWQTIQRPLARGIPVFQGYNPTQMKLELKVGRWNSDPVPGSWRTGSDASEEVEGDLFWFGYLAGEGFPTGPSPVVRIYPNETDLLPAQWTGKANPWICTALEWGTAYRENITGRRYYQEFTMTLLQWIASPGLKTPGAPSPIRSGSYFKTTSAINTPLKIANHVTPKSNRNVRERLARSIVNAPQNASLFKGRGGINTQIKPGTKVFVQQSALT